MTSNPEIAAPVATLEMCKAAVHNGADSIYVGFPRFNARAKSKELRLEELREIIDYCHLYGVKVAVCLNVVIFEEELEGLVNPLIQVIELGPDSFVVQDIGIARLLKYMAPDLKTAASTQMTVTDSRAVRITDDLGFARYIMARELPITEITTIRNSTGKEIEVFAHGALCVSYSGQCLSSESRGGRSANRGQCAQSCRLKYELSIDGTEGHKQGYFLSPRDLCALDVAFALKEAGVSALKIEGRMKPPEYVAAAVSAWKSVLEKDEAGPETQALKKELGLIFSRGFCTGFLEGNDHKTLVPGSYSGHVGVDAGEVIEVRARSVIVQGDIIPEAGEGALFLDPVNGSRTGGNIYRVVNAGEGKSELEFASGFSLKDLKEGMTFYLNSSPALESEKRKSWNDRERMKRIPVNLIVEGRAGEELKVAFQDLDGNRVEGVSQSSLVEAHKASTSLTEERILKELGKLGGGPFRLEDSSISIEENLFLDNHELKELRQSLSEALIRRRQVNRPVEVKKDAEIVKWLSSGKADKTAGLSGKPEINLLLRNPRLVQSVNGLPVSGICLDFEDLRYLSDSVSALKEYGFRAAVATPRIHREGDDKVLKMIAGADPDCVLVRSLGAFEYFLSLGVECHCDFSFNVTNHLSARWLLGKGAGIICPSFDLDFKQLGNFIASTAPGKLEVPVFFHSPLFHTEHCLFAANIGNGQVCPDCGWPCEKHCLRLTDSYGTVHLVKADPCCRNTLYAEEPVSMLDQVGLLLKMGIRRFRIEEQGEDLQKLLKIIRDLEKYFAASGATR